MSFSDGLVTLRVRPLPHGVSAEPLRPSRPALGPDAPRRRRPLSVSLLPPWLTAHLGRCCVGVRVYVCVWGGGFQEPVKIQVDLLGLSDGILAEIRPCGTFTCAPAPPSVPAPPQPQPPAASTPPPA